MKIIRYLGTDGQLHHAAQQDDGTAYDIDGDLYGDSHVTERRSDIQKLLAPIVPSVIIGIGLNYRHHAAETGAKVPEYPIVFTKTPNTLQNPNDPILIPTFLRSDEVDYEGELAVVIGKRGKNIAKEQALNYVLGYTAANDVSARDWQMARGGSQWTRGKSFDTFCPLGPCLVTPEEISNPNSLGIKTVLSGEVVQDWNTSDMIFDVPALIAFLSASTTLLLGTVILTGTPQGVGMARKPPRWLKPGDIVSIEIEKIGTLTNPVEAER
ncbi:MAG: fumarylacetoacetate hydrolase family protein [Armatimonadota bacterium]|nr:fumarylacetoacetate hydrolase family protein [Armatimonadota bacterium]